MTIAREVNGKWYPVPCPDGVSLALSFTTAEACAAFCDALGPLEDAFDAEIEKREQAVHDELKNDAEEAESNGYDRGFDEGQTEARDDARKEALEECAEGTCPGYDIGWSDGFAQAREVAA